MTTIKRSSKGATVEALVASDPDLMKALMKQALQKIRKRSTAPRLPAGTQACTGASGSSSSRRL